MTTPTWPSELPCAVMDASLSPTMADGRLRASTDTGPGKVRLLNSAAVTPASAAIVCDANQLARFNRFWTEDVGRGVLPFLIRDQELDALPLLDEDGTELTDESDETLLNSAWWLVQFGTPPSRPTLVSRQLFRVNFELLILP